MDLFNPNPTPKTKWEFPNLSEVKRIGFDTETNGLYVYGKSKPIGLSISVDKHTGWYLPWGHPGGYQLDPEKVKEWCINELAGKELVMHNAPFDIEMMYKWGVDLEQIGCTVRNIQHPAALIDVNTRDLNLDFLSRRYIGKKKIELKSGLDIWEMQASSVELYAINDAKLTIEVGDELNRRIDNIPGLRQVLDLEDNLIFCVQSMMREGVLVDVDLLEQWHRQIQKLYQQKCLELWQLVGRRIEPTKPTYLEGLYGLLGIEVERTAKGSPSFTYENMKPLAGKFPAIQLVMDCKDLESIDSKFVNKYLKAADSNNIVRTVLHQLKAVNEEGSNTNGTVTGRFSSSGGGKYIHGVNIQQAAKVEEHDTEMFQMFPIRRAIIPREGHEWLSADASQIEFRIFGHYARNKGVLEAFSKNPWVDYHAIVSNLISRPRGIAKTINFGRIYGMGIKKLAADLGIPLSQAKKIAQEYDKIVPEASDWLQKAKDAAKKRGYVHTLYGRYRQYPVGMDDREYLSALNAIIQGSAADYMKIKLLRLYNSRKDTGLIMRFTVHDEVDGDIPTRDSISKVETLLNEQEWDLKIPILWKVEVGPNWQELEAA